MARADLLIKLVKAGISSDQTLFKKVVESIIAEEKSKQHHVVAQQLLELLQNNNQNQTLNQTNNRLLDNKLDNFLYRIYPQKTLDDIILNYSSSKIMQDLIQEHHRSDFLRSYNLEPRNRILLSGPPGNGKTSLAEALAHSLMIPFYVIRYDGIIGSYLGETATRLKATFDYIRTQECVLFFDEFDSIGKERGDIHETGEIKRVVSSLLLQIDRLPTYVVVVAATNHPELLDRAVWRRFQIRLELDTPDKKMIESWLRKFEKKIQYNLQYSVKEIAEKLEGRNFAEIEDFMHDIQRKYILSLPEVNIKKVVDECFGQLENKFSLGDG